MLLIIVTGVIAFIYNHMALILFVFMKEVCPNNIKNNTIGVLKHLLLKKVPQKHLHMYMHLHCPHIDAFIHFLSFHSYFHLHWDVILPFIFSLDLDITFSKLSLYNPLIQSIESISVHYTLTLYLKSNRHVFFISSIHLCEFQPKKLCIVFQ